VDFKGVVVTALASAFVGLLGYVATRSARKEAAEAKLAAARVQEQTTRLDEFTEITKSQREFNGQLIARLRAQDDAHEEELKEERRRHAEQLRQERGRTERILAEFAGHREQCSAEIRGLRTRVEQAEQRADVLAHLVSDEIAAAAGLVDEAEQQERKPE
jgi:hypothetical protein